MATVLLVLFDETDSLNNVMSMCTLRPDRVYILGGAKMELSRTQRLFNTVAREVNPQTDIVFLPCLGADLSMLTETMNHVLSRHAGDTCVLDAVGGGETYLLAAGACWQEHPELQLLSMGKAKRELRYLNGPRQGETLPVDFSLTVRQAIAFAGGELLRCGHADWRDLGEKMLSLIPRVFRVYQAHRKNWPRFVNWLQQMNRAEYAQGNNTFTAPARISTGKGHRLTADTDILTALKGAGAVTRFTDDGDTITVRFYSAQLLKFLCDTGAWLELYLFYVLHKHGLSDNCELNAVISWEEGDRTATTNELDLIAMNGLTQLFISCKSGIPDNAALNEIGTLTAHFGTRYARPVLATASNLAKDAPAVYRRALEMGVRVIDAPLLSDENALVQAFRDMV